jgi:hypothetical protein
LYGGGDGDGGFRSGVSYSAGIGPNAVTAADFNADGRTDFAIANGGSNSMSVLLYTCSP